MDDGGAIPCQGLFLDDVDKLKRWGHPGWAIWDTGNVELRGHSHPASSMT